MPSPMYTFSVPVFVKTLGNLVAILGKGAAYAEQKKFDPAVLVNMRLAPDMYPLLRQVRIACDFAKGSASRLAGEEPPSWEDNEATIADLQARIERTVAYLQGFDPARFDGAEERTVTLTIRGEKVEFQGLDYLRHVALPNFFFHATTAYDILRHAGVELGKRDFIGKV